MQLTILRRWVAATAIVATSASLAVVPALGRGNRGRGRPGHHTGRHVAVHPRDQASRGPGSIQHPHGPARRARGGPVGPPRGPGGATVGIDRVHPGRRGHHRHGRCPAAERHAGDDHLVPLALRGSRRRRPRPQRDHAGPRTHSPARGRADPDHALHPPRGRRRPAPEGHPGQAVRPRGTSGPPLDPARLPSGRRRGVDLHECGAHRQPRPRGVRHRPAAADRLPAGLPRQPPAPALAQRPGRGADAVGGLHLRRARHHRSRCDARPSPAS